MFASRFAWIGRRSGRTGIRRLSGTSRVDGGLSQPSDQGLVRAFAGTAAGILAVGGGLWLIPSSTDSPFALADDGTSSGFKSFRSGLLQSWNDKKPKFIFSESFRKRVFFNYEKRLRLQSRPEKIFEYFASFRSPEGEVLMSAADLMRAIVPVFPPSESHIIREGNLRGERLPGELHCPPSALFMLFDTNSDGLISFPEYIFLVTLLSIPESNFRVAFQMFDLDNNGEIGIEEFKKVMALMRSYNRHGAHHSNGLRIGLKVRRSVDNSGLLHYFFGEDGKQNLQHDEFVKFLKELHNEILRLEFDHYDYKGRKTICSKDFALSLIASADVSHINKLLERVDELDKNLQLGDIYITFEEFKAFAELRKKLGPLTLAIFSYGRVNGLLTKQDFKRAASQVCSVTLSDNVIDIIFHVFDANRDGHLSLEEFLRTMQRREYNMCHPSVMGGLVSGFCLKCSKFCSPIHTAAV